MTPNAVCSLLRRVEPECAPSIALEIKRQQYEVDVQDHSFLLVNDFHAQVLQVIMLQFHAKKYQRTK